MWLITNHAADLFNIFRQDTKADWWLFIVKSVESFLSWTEHELKPRKMHQTEVRTLSTLPETMCNNRSNCTLAQQSYPLQKWRVIFKYSEYLHSSSRKLEPRSSFPQGAGGKERSSTSQSPRQEMWHRCLQSSQVRSNSFIRGSWAPGGHF